MILLSDGRVESLVALLVVLTTFFFVMYRQCRLRREQNRQRQRDAFHDAIPWNGGPIPFFQQLAAQLRQRNQHWQDGAIDELIDHYENVVRYVEQRPDAVDIAELRARVAELERQNELRQNELQGRIDELGRQNEALMIAVAIDVRHRHLQRQQRPENERNED